MTEPTSHAAPAAPIRVLIADDHEVVRIGLATLLDGQPGLTVVAEAASGADAVRPEHPVTRRAGWMRPVLALVIALAASTVALVAGPGAPAGAAPGPAPDGRAQRVLVISVPGLTWAEVRDHDLPAIEGLLEGSAMADMAPRGVSARSTPGAATRGDAQPGGSE